jgi:hypothetical protein
MVITAGNPMKLLDRQLTPSLIMLMAFVVFTLLKAINAMQMISGEQRKGSTSKIIL